MLLCLSDAEDHPGLIDGGDAALPEQDHALRGCGEAFLFGDKEFLGRSLPFWGQGIFGEKPSFLGTRSRDKIQGQDPGTKSRPSQDHALPKTTSGAARKENTLGQG